MPSVGVMLRTSFRTPEWAGRGRGGWACGGTPGVACFGLGLGGRGEWYNQGTSTAVAKGDNCAKCESRKAERVGSDGRADCAFVGFESMLVVVSDVVFAPATAVESGGAKG